MSTETDRKPGAGSTLAGEYVLGTLDDAAKRRFERRLATDPTLQVEVERWEHSLYRLAEAVPPLAPSPQVWARIRRAIDEAARDPVVTPRAPRPSVVASLWESLGFWRGWSLAASTLVMVLAVALFVVPGATQVTYVVVVTDDAQSRASWVVSGEAGSNEIRVRSLAPQPVPADRVFQLWVLPAGSSTVRSVGLIPPEGDERLTIPPEIATLLGTAQKFGVSVEPPGGSPTGQPTTTPLYHGKPLAL